MVLKLVFQMRVLQRLVCHLWNFSFCSGLGMTIFIFKVFVASPLWLAFLFSVKRDTTRLLIKQLVTTYIFWRWHFGLLQDSAFDLACQLIIGAKWKRVPEAFLVSLHSEARGWATGQIPPFQTSWNICLNRFGDMTAVNWCRAVPNQWWVSAAS